MLYIIKGTDFVLGGYKSIEKLEDRYRCDNTDVPFSVVDPCTIEEVLDDWVNPAIIAQKEAAEKAAFNEQQKKRRAAAYPTQSDPIFFKAQRGEATMQDWEDAVDAIKQRYPYQE